MIIINETVGPINYIGHWKLSETTFCTLHGSSTDLPAIFQKTFYDEFSQQEYDLYETNGLVKIL